MKKQLQILILALAAIVTGQSAFANAIPTYTEPDIKKLLAAPELTYNKDAVPASSWRDNWFVNISGGVNSFLGNPLGCEDLWGRIKPQFEISVGKWVTSHIGGRVSFNGFQIKNGELATQDYWGAHGDLLYNVLGDKSRFDVVPFVGVGLLHNSASGQNPFAINYGVMGQYRLAPRVKLTLELANATTFNNFDGLGSSRFGGDNLLSLSAGLSFTIGGNGFKRVVDAKPILSDNARLRDCLGSLYYDNQRLFRQSENDSRVIAELKKILEIEGLLGRYGNRLNALSGGNPDDIYKSLVNDYSGLNSLRARMSGDSDLDNMKKASKAAKLKNRKRKADNNAGNGTNLDNQSNGNSFDMVGLSDLNAEYLSLIAHGEKCIGSPILFFFKIGTTNLTDQSQLVNLDEIAKVANHYGLAVRITGAADSATGNTDINNTLGCNRASYIYDELLKRGVDTNVITTVNDGGIDRLNPTEANRHTRIELFVGS